MTLVQTLVTALLLGGIYALVALGFSLTWGLLRTLNFAHFGFALVCAYVTYTLSATLGWDPMLALLVTIPLGILLMMGLQWFVQKTKLDTFATLIATFGLLLMIEAAIAITYSHDLVRIPTTENPWSTMVLSFGRVTVPIVQLIALFAALVLCLGTWYLLHRTGTGLSIRAAIADRPIATAYGIDTQRLAYVVAILGGASVGVFGAVVGMTYTLSPTAGLAWVPITLAVVLLGGLGNPLGTAIAAFVLALAETLTRQYASPGLAQLVSLTILVIVLVLRPQGLFKSISEVKP